VTGFKDEKALWKWQRPRLKGKWDRYELVTPAGHPDIKGSYKFELFYIENKVGDYRDVKQRWKAMEGAQVEYLDWLSKCGQKCFVCFGGEKAKTVTFYRWADGWASLLFPASERWLPFWRS
jgi:hypothetical protein